METKFDFKSQVCTSREQSERLLALGLKKETADMYWTNPFGDWITIVGGGKIDEDNIPAWSLHRLIEIAGDDTGTIAIRYEGVTFNKDIYFYSHPTTYDNLIDCIEWIIKEDALKKQYLEE